MSNRNAHERKYDTMDKIALMTIGLLLTGISGMQLYYSSNLSELAVVASQMKTVINNQSTLQSTVGKIQIQVVKNCERSKLYWPDHDGEC